jgi:CRP/FNR family cyclic AMP-dependent transcriptional regulator
MSWIEIIGYIGAIATVITYSMKTIIPLRIAGICANLIFIAYGYLANVHPPLILACVLLPLNIFRLYQMIKLVNDIKASIHGDASVSWIAPYSSASTFKAGDIVFKKGDKADAIYYVSSGEFEILEISSSIKPGELVGEVGLISPDNKRSLSLKCVTDGNLLSISYEKVRQLYFQNPQFGLYLIQLLGNHLFRDIARLENALETFRPTV